MPKDSSRPHALDYDRSSHLDGREMGGLGVSLQVWVKNPGGRQLAAARVTRLQK